MPCFKTALKSFVTRLEFKAVFQLSKTFNKFFKLNKWSKAIATRNSCGFTSTKELKEINESLFPDFYSFHEGSKSFIKFHKVAVFKLII